MKEDLMNESEGQPAANGSSPLSDDTLRRYLLCRLDDDERLRLDQRLLIDDRLAERMLLAESELIDDYAEGKLEGVERDLFTRRFLITESRKQKLRFSSALQNYAESQLAAPIPRIIEPAKSSWWAGFASLTGFGRPRAWAVAGSFAVLVLVVGLVWFLAKQSRDAEPLIARHEPTPASAPDVPARVEVSPGPVSSPQPTPSKKPESLPTPPEPSVPARIASFVLLTGSVRAGGEMSRLAVPDGEQDIVRLSLIVETAGPGVYQAELATAEGQKLMVRSRLKVRNTPTEAKVSIDIPARLLKSGDYQIKLTRQKPDGQSESAGRYYFRALEE